MYNTIKMIDNIYKITYQIIYIYVCIFKIIEQAQRVSIWDQQLRENQNRLEYIVDNVHRIMSAQTDLKSSCITTIYILYSLLYCTFDIYNIHFYLRSL